MCLITTQKEPKIAKKDTVAYKLLLSTATSIHECFSYELGLIYKTEIKESNDWCAFDDIDMDYLNENYPDWAENKRKNPNPDYPLKCFGPGFHSAKTRKRLLKTKSYGECLFECIIPFGSEYYEDATGLFVSNQIIIVRKLTKD